MGNRAGNEFKKLVIPTFFAEVGTTSCVVWSLICIFLSRWRIWSGRKCVTYARGHLSLLSDSRAHALLWYRQESSDSPWCWKSFLSPALRVLCNTSPCRSVAGLWLRNVQNCMSWEGLQNLLYSKKGKQCNLFILSDRNWAWLQMKEEQQLTAAQKDSLGACPLL